MEPTRKGFKLSSGRTFYAYGSRLSLGPEISPFSDGRLRAHYGSDGALVPDSPYSCEISFTADERREIADYMAALWRAWGALPAETKKGEQECRNSN